MKITRKELREMVKEEVTNLNESRKVNPVEIADVFTRFLIGDRKSAIKQLQSKFMDADVGIIETPGTPEYNKQFDQLTTRIERAIKSEM